MSVLEELRRLSAAEEFFVYLDVPYDAAVLSVARLHILRRMGETLSRESLAGLDDSTVRDRFRAHLQAAYGDFLARSPLEERVFRVLKKAAGRDAGPLVPISALSRK